MSNEPIPKARLEEFAVQACEAALADAIKYDHSQTPSWNTTIINEMIAKLKAETTGYKFGVYSVLLQRGSSDELVDRGLHAANGAYWDTETDGSWSFTYEKPEKTITVVLSIFWIGI